MNRPEPANVAREPYSATKSQANYEAMKHGARSWTQVRLEELSKWYESACEGRDRYKAHAEALAAALRDVLPYAEGYKSSEGPIERSEAALAAWDKR